MAKKSSKHIAALDDPVIVPFQANSRGRARSDRLENEHARRSATINRRNDLLPELKFLKKPLHELQPRRERIRKLKEQDILEALNAMADGGVIQAIAISNDGSTILDGEARFEAAKRLGLPYLPCYQVVGLSPDEERAAVIRLNRLGQRREWDLDVLKVELKALELRDIRVDTLGFDDIELDQIRAIKSVAEAVPGDGEDELPIVSRLGDTWELGDHRVHNGDARSPDCYAVLMGHERAQIVITDPPYNLPIATAVSTSHEEFANASGEMTDEEYAAFLMIYLVTIKERMAKGAIAYIFIDWRQIEVLLRAVRGAGFELMNVITWVKTNAGMGSFYRSHHELVVMCKFPGQHKNRIQLGARGRDRSNVWFAAGAGTLGSDSRAMLGSHPTSKPVRILSDALADACDSGDIVLDGFGGSGSTLIAAEDMGRRARLIELEPSYCDLIIRRWQRHTGNNAVLAETGKTFAEVAAERLGEVAQPGDYENPEIVNPPKR